MRELTKADRQEIVVGRILPFAVYAADRTLLLASGQLVPNDFIREGLLRSGVYCAGASSSASESDSSSATEFTDKVSLPIESLILDYRRTSARAQVGFRMEKEAQGTAYTSRVMGVTETGALLMSAPIAADGTRVVLKQGETWTFRALYAVSALRFNATIAQIDVSPGGYFYAANIRQMERRDVRKWPRVPTCLMASRQGESPRVIVDLSVGGARIATDNGNLQRGQQILLNPTIKVLDKEQSLSLKATVLNLYSRADPKHPSIHFFGVQFEKIPDMQRLAIHAYVQEQLCLELDRVSHVFAVPSAV